MPIDELVDKVLAKHKSIEDEVKKDTNESKKDASGPFRYITDEEMQQESEIEKPAPVSVMTFSDETRTLDVDQDIFTLAIGDLDKIESVLKKHENIKKNRLE